LIRKRFKSHSKVVAEKEVLAIRTLQESLFGIRDIILGKFHEKFTKDYFLHRRALDTTSGKIAFLTASPRYLIEGLGILLIIFLAVDAYQGSQKPELVLPSLGVLALGAQRLLPYLQQLYASYATIVSSEQSVLDALEVLEHSNEDVSHNNTEIRFEKSIELKNCFFKYSIDSNEVLNGVNLTIKKGQKVGFIGSTGSGKSTLIDIMMGFLNPSKGSLLIDGKVIDKDNIHDWQSKIFHVPQQIILSDTSIKNNIAFGIEESAISHQRVVDSCEKAKLTDYIKELDKGYDSLVGERGIQLSGGQRQRIGIARALYKGGEVIILDEATNALDNKTESMVSEAIDSLSESITKIIVAHNHETIKNCDIIFILQEGSIVEAGNYKELQKTERFKEIFENV
jgi:ATP-binding cassette subfamily B protein